MSMSQARIERRTERRRRKYRHEHQVIEALARKMASRAYEGMRQDGPSTHIGTTGVAKWTRPPWLIGGRRRY
jgi:hypothetical protein